MELTYDDDEKETEYCSPFTAMILTEFLKDATIDVEFDDGKLTLMLYSSFEKPRASSTEAIDLFGRTFDLTEAATSMTFEGSNDPHCVEAFCQAFEQLARDVRRELKNDNPPTQ